MVFGCHTPDFLQCGDSFCCLFYPNLAQRFRFLPLTAWLLIALADARLINEASHRFADGQRFNYGDASKITAPFASITSRSWRGHVLELGSMLSRANISGSEQIPHGSFRKPRLTSR